MDREEKTSTANASGAARRGGRRGMSLAVVAALTAGALPVAIVQLGTSDPAPVKRGVATSGKAAAPQEGNEGVAPRAGDLKAEKPHGNPQRCKPKRRYNGSKKNKKKCGPPARRKRKN